MYKTITHKKILHQKLVGRVATKIYLKHDKVQLPPKTANINKNKNPIICTSSIHVQTANKVKTS